MELDFARKQIQIRKETKFLRPGSKALTRDALLVNSVVLYENINGESVVKGLYELLDYEQLPTIYTYDEMNNFISPEYPFSKNQNEDERKKNEYIVYEIDAENMRELTDADKKEYVRLIKENGIDKNGRLGEPFII